MLRSSGDTRDQHLFEDWQSEFPYPSHIMIKLRRLAVATSKRILLLLSATMISILAGCGGGTKTVQNPPPPPVTAVSIAFQPAPIGSIPITATTALTAVVSNDSTNAGVDWSLLCNKNTKCGSLSPLHTDSGKAAIYTPPATISGDSQTVTIEAFATADPSKNIVTPVTVTNPTVTGFDGSLKGTYVFQTRGIDVNGVFQLAGVITLDGKGGITSGEQTHSDVLQSLLDPIIGGSYTIGPDGRGTLTIKTADPNIGQLGIENLSLVVLSPSQALIATLDDPNLQTSGETSSGTLDMQISPTAPTGGYAFSVTGTDVVTLLATAWGGIINVDAPRTISGAGSLVDQDVAGTLTNCPAPAFSGTVSDPDSYGMVKFDLTFDPTVCFVSSPTIEFTGYIVDGVHIKLIESDTNGSGTGGATSGIAIAQGAATGTFIDNKSFAGTYVFGILGQDPTGFATSLASVGEFASDSNGNITSGFNDEFLAGSGIQISDALTGTYTLDSTGSGRVDSFLSFTNNGPGPEFIFYLTGNGNPPLILDADATLGSIGSGIAYPQAAPPSSFNGKYGLYFTQGSSGAEIDGTARIAADPTTGTLSGVVDTNFFLSSNPNTPLTGTFGTIPQSGRFTGTLNNTLFPTPGTAANTLAMAFYLIDSAHGFFIETDSVASGELTFGYFAARTPVCQGCK